MFQYLQQVCRAFVSFAPYWRLPLRMPLVIQPPFRLRKLFSPKIFVHHFHCPLLMLLMHNFASFRYLLYILLSLAFLVFFPPLFHLSCICLIVTVLEAATSYAACNSASFSTKEAFFSKNFRASFSLPASNAFNADRKSVV